MCHVGAVVAVADGGFVASDAGVVGFAARKGESGPDLRQLDLEGVEAQAAVLEREIAGVDDENIGEGVLDVRGEHGVERQACPGDQAVQRRGDDLVSADCVLLSGRVTGPLLDLAQGHGRRLARGRDAGGEVVGVIAVLPAFRVEDDGAHLLQFIIALGHDERCALAARRLAAGGEVEG